MELNLNRQIRTELSTIGRLSIDGEAVCYILEDTDRGLDSHNSLGEIKSRKIAGKTAIPAGRYQIVVNMSNRFGKLLPLLIGVPGYEGVRIHPGNRPEDTEGCLLPGMTHSPNFVTDSRTAYNILIAKIMKGLEDGDVWIRIE